MLTVRFWALWALLFLVASDCFAAPDAPPAEQSPPPKHPSQSGPLAPESITERERTSEAQAEALQAVPAQGDYTIIPLPAFSYNRNEGAWVGALAPILKANDKGELEHIFAPQYLHNRWVGETGTLNYYGYRSDTAQYRAVLSYAEKIERNIDFGYKDLGAGEGGRYIIGLEGGWFKNAFARFFGFGNRTQERNETNYTSREGHVKATVGVNVNQDFAIMFTERYRDVRIENGAVADLPQTKLLFPDVRGLEGAQIFGHRLTFRYDTRDKQLTPSRGTYVNFLLEFDQNLHHDEPNRWWRTTFDARHLIPHADDQMVFVARIMADTVNGRTVPFYERPTLGGEITLRAFGLGRYVGDTALLVNFEERIRVKERKFFDYLIELEAAPYLDIGRVASHVSINKLGNMQINPGLGIRVLARPHVVGRLDIAYGRDGDNVFVGLDYPF